MNRLKRWLTEYPGFAREYAIFATCMLTFLALALLAIWLSFRNQQRGCIPPPDLNPRIVTSGQHFCRCLDVDANNHVRHAWDARKDGLCYSADMPH